MLIWKGSAIGMQAMKERQQNIEHSRHRSQACLDVGTEPMYRPVQSVAGLLF